MTCAGIEPTRASPYNLSKIAEHQLSYMSMTTVEFESTRLTPHDFKSSWVTNPVALSMIKEWWQAGELNSKGH